MKKRSLQVFLTLFLVISLFSGVTGAKASTDLQVKLDNQIIQFSQNPYIVNGRTLVSVHMVAEQLGGELIYHEESKSATIMKGSNTVNFTVGQKVANVNGIQLGLDVAPEIVEQTMRVPLRFLFESMGYDVDFEPKTRTVLLKENTEPSIKILGPTEGSLLYTDKVQVGVSVFKHELADFRTYSTPKVGQGHVHIWLDTDVNDPKIAYKLVNGEPVTFDDVKPGEHTLTVQLVGNDHKPISPAVKKVVKFNTKKDAASPKQDTAPKTSTLTIKDFKFSPDPLTISVGSTLTITNNDEAAHTVTAKDGSFDSDLLSKGESKTIAFNKAGEYEIYCKPHTFMIGKIIVEDN